LREQDVSHAKQRRCEYTPEGNDVGGIKQALPDVEPIVVEKSMQEQAEPKTPSCILLVEDDVLHPTRYGKSY
jgi:hypothetical protein